MEPSNSSPKPKFTLQEFSHIFEILKNEHYGVIGGHAISAWVENLLSKDEIEKLSGFPILSKDLDLRSSQAEKIANLISEKLNCPKPVYKNIKHLPGIDNPDQLKKFLYVVHIPIKNAHVGVDIFRMVPKLDQSNDHPEPSILHTLPTKNNKIFIKVWDPITLFKTKAHTYMDRVELGTWKDRNDLLHLKALEMIIPAYLKKVSKDKTISPSWHTNRLRDFLVKYQGKIPLTPTFLQKYGVPLIALKNNHPESFSNSENQPRKRSI